MHKETDMIGSMSLEDDHGPGGQVGGTRGHASANNDQIGDVPESLAHQQPPESKDVRADAFEKQYRALQQQLRQRDMAMMELAEENEHLNKALTDLKEHSKDALGDRERLIEKIKRQQIGLNSIESSLRKAQAEAIDARKDANEARRDANDARREATESSVALADAKAEVWAVQQAAKGKALGEDERRELEGALRALSASAQRASQEAGTWKDNAHNINAQLENVKQELEGKSSVVMVMEAELAFARQQVKDSDLKVQEAGRLQSLAEGALQDLRQESDRRARTFNAAVKAAVGKIQSDLQSELDAALERTSTLQTDVELQTETLKERSENLTTKELELSTAKKVISQLEAEQQQTKAEIDTLMNQVNNWKRAARSASDKADAAHETSEGLLQKVEKLECRCEELTASSDLAVSNAASLEASLVSEISQLKSSLNSVKNEKQLLQIDSAEKNSKVMADQVALRSTIADLEAQVAALGVQSSGRKGKQLDYGLNNLGLERVNWKSKLRDQGFERQMGKQADRDESRPSTLSETNSWSWPQSSHHETTTSILRGRLSQRSIVMIIYIVLLHIIVMVSFTQRSQNCVEIAGQDMEGKLPGL